MKITCWSWQMIACHEHATLSFLAKCWFLHEQYLAQFSIVTDANTVTTLSNGNAIDCMCNLTNMQGFMKKIEAKQTWIQPFWANS